MTSTTAATTPAGGRTRSITGGAVVAAAAIALTATGSAAHAAGPVIPPAGSGTAYGYTAMITHRTSATDGKGTLVVRAADGRTSSIGSVSDDAVVYDVSNNARTVLTGFTAPGTNELRLTVWDTATRVPTYVRVAGGGSAALAENGIVVTRASGNAQYLNRTGGLIRTYATGLGGPATVSADGRTVYDTSGGAIRPRSVSTGAVLRTLALPSGTKSCEANRQLSSSEIGVSCTADPASAPSRMKAFRLNTTTGSATAPITGTGASGDLRTVTGGWVYDAAYGTPDVQPRFQKASGAKSAVGSSNRQNVVVGARATSVFYLEGPSATPGTPTTRLLSKDLSSGRVSALAGQGSTAGGLVTSARVIDGS